MNIAVNTKMLLFRFNNFGKNSFISAHMEILQKFGYVWMLKLGRRSNIEKLKEIKENGGWLVLRSPKADGSMSYIAKFSDISEKEPKDGVYPNYYDEILSETNDQGFYDPNRSYQWFKIEIISELTESDANTLFISESGKSVNDVIGTTRTAVMYIQNNKAISV